MSKQLQHDYLAAVAGMFNCSINQSKRMTSYANGQTNLKTKTNKNLRCGNLNHKHKAPDHNHEATQPMVDLPL